MLLSLFAGACALDATSGGMPAEDAGLSDAQLEAGVGEHSSLPPFEPAATRGVAAAPAHARAAYQVGAILLAPEGALQAGLAAPKVVAPEPSAASDDAGAVQAAAVAPPEPEPEPEPDDGSYVDTETHCDPASYEEPTRPPAPPGVVHCGDGVVCVPPVTDPRAACQAALALWRADLSDCTDPQALATANDGLLRAAALLEVTEPDMVTHYVVVLASERGYDRVLGLYSSSYSSNTDRKTEFTTFALEQLVPGGPRELHIESKTTFEWSNCTDPGGIEGERTDFGVCGLDSKSSPYCLGRVPRTYSTRKYDWDEQAEALVYRPLSKLSFDVRFTGKALVVKHLRGRVPRPLRPLLGRHATARAAKLVDRANAFGP